MSEEKSEAYKLGWQARLDGEAASPPYEKDVSAYQEWLNGWRNRYQEDWPIQ